MQRITVCHTSKLAVYLTHSQTFTYTQLTDISPHTYRFRLYRGNMELWICTEHSYTLWKFIPKIHFLWIFCSGHPRGVYEYIYCD